MISKLYIAGHALTGDQSRPFISLYGFHFHLIPLLLLTKHWWFPPLIKSNTRGTWNSVAMRSSKLLATFPLLVGLLWLWFNLLQRLLGSLNNDNKQSVIVPINILGTFSDSDWIVSKLNYVPLGAGDFDTLKNVPPRKVSTTIIITEITTDLNSFIWSCRVH